MRKIECFKIRILEDNGAHIWAIENQRPIHDVVCDHFSSSLNPVTIVADPFLFVYQEKLFLFYEKKRNYSPGVICMTCTEDLTHWSDPVVVLEENIHLSYPYVFEESGNVYMIPETSDVGDIRLYKADNNMLSGFSLSKTLIHHDVIEGEIGFVDSSVLKKDGRFYLFSSIEQNGNNVLFLFVSEKLEGPYLPHPSSPVCKSMKYGRNGGSVIEHKGLLYRVAQDCENRYGDDLHLFTIDELSPLVYKEHLIKESMVPRDLTYYKEGGHQYNFVRFKGKYIVATDSKEYNSYLLCRMTHKTICIFDSIFNKAKRNG